MVKVKILDESGHTEQILEAEEAVETVLNHCQNGKWVYVDGKYYPLPEITSGTLEDAAECVITPPIQAG
jgi:hypothetical protein